MVRENRSAEGLGVRSAASEPALFVQDSRSDNYTSRAYFKIITSRGLPMQISTILTFIDQKNRFRSEASVNNFRGHRQSDVCSSCDCVLGVRVRRQLANNVSVGEQLVAFAKLKLTIANFGVPSRYWFQPQHWAGFTTLPDSIFPSRSNREYFCSHRTAYYDLLIPLNRLHRLICVQWLPGVPCLDYVFQITPMSRD